MRFRSHVNATFALSVASMAGVAACARIFPSASGHPATDVALMTVSALVGSGLVDVDTVWCGKGHRTRSVLHKLEAPLVGFLMFAAALVFSSLRFGAQSAITVSLASGVGFCAGWFFHLCGDFVEGGVGSWIFGRKVGFTSMGWTAYDGTAAGVILDFSVFAFAVVSIVWLLASPSSFHSSFSASLAEGISGARISPRAGVLFAPLGWALCMMWGRKGFRSFAANIAVVSFFAFALWLGRNGYFSRFFS